MKLPSTRLLIFCVLFLGAPRIWAQSPPPLRLELGYDVEEELEGCPTEEQFRRQIADQLAFSPLRGSVPHSAQVRLFRQSEGIAGALSWRSRTGAVVGERRLPPEGLVCSEVARNLAFAIVVHIQLMDSAPPAPAVVEPRRLPRRPIAKPPRREAPRWSWTVGVGGLGEYGRTPQIAPLVRAFSGLSGAGVNFEAGVKYWFPGDWRRADGRGLRSDLLTGTLATCWVPAPLELCILVDAGSFRSGGLGVDNSAKPAALASAASLRLRFSQLISTRVLAAAHLDFGVPLVRHEVVLAAEPIWTTEPFTLSLGVDLSAVLR